MYCLQKWYKILLSRLQRVKDDLIQYRECRSVVFATANMLLDRIRYFQRVSRKTVLTRSENRKKALAAKVDEAIKEIHRLERIFKNAKIVTRQQVRNFKRKGVNVTSTRRGLSERRRGMFSHFRAGCFMLGEICASCREDLKVGMHLVRLDCNHVFCNECTDAWFAGNRTCPLCVRDLRWDICFLKSFPVASLIVRYAKIIWYKFYFLIRATFEWLHLRKFYLTVTACTCDGKFKR